MIQSVAKYLTLLLVLLKEIIIFANDIQHKNYRLINLTLSLVIGSIVWRMKLHHMQAQTLKNMFSLITK